MKITIEQKGKSKFIRKRIIGTMVEEKRTVFKRKKIKVESKTKIFLKNLK